MSHTAIVEFPCNPGQGKGLLETLSAALVDTRAFEGCESIEVYADNEDPDRIVLWEKWAERANYDAYLAWRMETGLMDVLAPFMDTQNLRIVNLDAHADV
jgi:quinol monooxygenase YgiN